MSATCVAESAGQFYLTATLPKPGSPTLPYGAMPPKAYCCSQCDFVELYAGEQIGLN